MSPDSEGGHQVSNNHFSTSEMDGGDKDPPTTVTPPQMETTTDHRSAVPEEVPTTHKIDAKKDLSKKKVKPTPKKKDKGVESEDASVDTDSDGMDESVHEIAKDVDITTHVPSTTMSHHEGDADQSTTLRLEMLNEDVFTTTEIPQEGMGTMSPTSAPLTTTKNENLLSSDEQPPQTTVNDDIAEITTTMRQQPREEMESQADTTAIPNTTEIPQVETTTSGAKTTENSESEDIDSTEPHLNAEMEITTSTAPPLTTDSDFERERNSLGDDLQPTTFLPMTVADSESDKNSPVNDLQPTTTLLPRTPVDSKSDNNSLGNDLKPTQVPDTVRKQKQLVLDGGCPCGPSFSQCVGGRTVADPTCPCREVCARQSGQACSPGEPCDEEFGLHCNPQNNTCTGECFFIYFFFPLCLTNLDYFHFWSLIYLYAETFVSF